MKVDSFVRNKIGDLETKEYSEYKKDLDVWSKRFRFKTVYTAANKLASNNVSIEFRELFVNGVREYHANVLLIVQANTCKVVPPPKIS